MIVYYFADLPSRNAKKIQDLLAYYEVASGQMINKEKTTLFFSGNMDERTQEATKVSLNAPTIQHYEKFLGLPSFVGRDKKACITQVKERIWVRMQGWRSFCHKLVRNS